MGRGELLILPGPEQVLFCSFLGVWSIQEKGRTSVRGWREERTVVHPENRKKFPVIRPELGVKREGRGTLGEVAEE